MNGHVNSILRALPFKCLKAVFSFKEIKTFIHRTHKIDQKGIQRKDIYNVKKFIFMISEGSCSVTATKHSALPSNE